MEIISKDGELNEDVQRFWGRIAAELTADQMPLGHTGYLDSLEPEAMSVPVMKGVDLHGRKFIALRLITTGRGGRPGSEGKTEHRGTVVIFQRFADKNNTWVRGCNIEIEPPDYMTHVNGPGSLPNIPTLMEIIGGKTVTVDRGGWNCKSVRLDV